MSEFWALEKAGFQLVSGVVRATRKALHGATRLGQYSAARHGRSWWMWSGDGPE